MAGSILVIGETLDGNLTRLSAEVATLARNLGEAGAGAVSAIVIGGDTDAAKELAGHIGGEVSRADPGSDTLAATAIVRAAADAGEAADYILLGASPDGRDAAGMLSVLLGRGVLANATAVTWEDGGPVVEMSVFGGKLVTRSGFTAGKGIITIRPNVVAAERAPTAGSVNETAIGSGPELGEVRIAARVSEAGAAASIEEAKVIVAGGRGVGGTAGFALIEELAQTLGGVVGATRAAVDAGWIPYSQQIGQTGKIVKPQLYLALGVSGAIQHKVGMQTAATIVAVNRDPDAPIAEFADLMVVGDLFEVGRALVEELRSRSG